VSGSFTLPSCKKRDPTTSTEKNELTIRTQYQAGNPEGSRHTRLPARQEARKVEAIEDSCNKAGKASKRGIRGVAMARMQAVLQCPSHVLCRAGCCK